jgi:alpha-1,2-mannosyltransferase
VVLWDLLLPDDSRWKGVGVGVAAGLKLTPALFVVYLLVTGRPVPAVRAMATFAGTVLVGWLLLPAESDAFWLGRLFMDPTRVGGPEYVGNQSINAGLVRLVDQGEQVLWIVAAAVVAIGGLAVARRAHRRGAELAGILVCAFTGLLVSPISWSHHWVWVVPVFACVVHVAVTRGGWAWAGPVVMLVVLSAPGWLWLLPRGGAVERSWNPWQMVVGSSYVLAALAGIVGFASWSARRDPADRPEPASAPPA